MENIVCIRHPNYNGNDNPRLSCETCCSIFVKNIKKEQDQINQSKFDARAWLAKKDKLTSQKQS